MNELAINRPMRLAEHIKSFSGSEKVRMIVGADLLERMLNPQIFTDLDLVEIERNCHLLLAPRNEVEIVTILQHLMKKRGVTLSATLIKTERLTKNLQRFFLISSPPLGGLLTFLRLNLKQPQVCYHLNAR